MALQNSHNAKLRTLLDVAIHKAQQDLCSLTRRKDKTIKLPKLHTQPINQSQDYDSIKEEEITYRLRNKSVRIQFKQQCTKASRRYSPLNIQKLHKYKQFSKASLKTKDIPLLNKLQTKIKQKYYAHNASKSQRDRKDLDESLKIMKNWLKNNKQHENGRGRILPVKNINKFHIGGNLVTK